MGMLKTNGPPFRMGQARRRSLPSPKRFAQAGRHFAVLTYAMYAPRVKMAAAFPSSGSGQDGLF